MGRQLFRYRDLQSDCKWQREYYRRLQSLFDRNRTGHRHGNDHQQSRRNQLSYDLHREFSAEYTSDVDCDRWQQLFLCRLEWQLLRQQHLQPPGNYSGKRFCQLQS